MPQNKLRMSIKSLFFLLLLFLFGGCSLIFNETKSPYSNTKKVGASAGHFLRSDTFKKLVVEIDYVAGTKLKPETVDSLTLFLEQLLHKPDGIFISIDEEIPSPKRRVFKAEHLQKIEKKYRKNFTLDSTLTVYVLVLDGAFKTNDLDGVAYNNTSIALFGDVIQKNYGGLGQPSVTTAQSAILMHEFGHLLGLVDKGSPMIQDHLEIDEGAHCSTEYCLMNSTIQTSDLNWNLTGGIIPKLDSLCIQDLKENGGK